MANRTGSAKAICPFYQKEAKLSITCEGLSDRTVCMTRFESVEDKAQFQAMNCEMYNYEHCCPLAAALMSKYQEEV